MVEMAWGHIPGWWLAPIPRSHSLGLGCDLGTACVLPRVAVVGPFKGIWQLCRGRHTGGEGRARGQREWGRGPGEGPRPGGDKGVRRTPNQSEQQSTGRALAADCGVRVA